MRLLVECSECHRQYDASRREIGSKFRCHCGKLLAVRQPQGHDARVVRCSSCGAPRSDDATQCPFCHSEFTLHERDLNTVCPHCLALVSDRAKFCHFCGTGLVPELDAGADTDLECPACQRGRGMVSRQIGTEKIAIMECGRCAGFWLGHDAFKLLLERAKQEVQAPGAMEESPRDVAAKFGLTQGAAAPKASRNTSYYRPCPVCHSLMNRRNYGGNSGVIIDLCREDGIWFDADELARIL
ncbi:MAG TPA: zf-TFIIB domain-containing protein, partial [Gemmata sp.]|nr:zf-TFIIB domain-containing protein [Gemmata sp.]